MKRYRTSRRFSSIQEHPLPTAGAPALDAGRGVRRPLPLVVAALAGVAWSCGSEEKQAGDGEALADGDPPMTADSPEFEAINEVLAAHADELMATPGVTGVAVGLLEDGRTPCLKILVAKLTPELEAGLPRSLGGHPVVVEVSGVIRRLDDR